MNRTIEPRVLKGFRDFLPEQEAPRAAMLRAIADAFETCGFAPLSTPSIEYRDILTGKYGDEGEKLLYHFTDHGDRAVALRYDLTVPLARVVAQHPEIPRPFKRYQIGTVWRAEKPAHGRFREFIQCDADIVGSSSALADAECVIAGITALRSLGVERFEVRIGHRAILQALLVQQRIEDPATQAAALRLIDKADKVGWDAVAQMLADLPGVGAERAQGLVASLTAGSGPLLSLDSLAPEAAAHLERVVEALRTYGVGDQVRVDLSIARGLDYYTGTVFETSLLDRPGVGSVMSGGRYDDLLRLFGEQTCPAVGLSIGVDRLFEALCELGCAPQARVGPACVVCPIGGSSESAAIALLARLHEARVASEIVLDPSWRLKKQLQYAARRDARFALILGEDEVASGLVTVKDLRGGGQQCVHVAEIANFLVEAVRTPERTRGI